MVFRPTKVLRRTMFSAPAAAGILAVGFRGAQASTSGNENGTFDEILRRRKAIIGIIVDFPPFGFLNAKHEPDGFDIELSHILTKSLGVGVEFVQCGTANRIPFLNAKRVDFLVADLGITPGRAKEVMFTIPYAATESILYAPAARKITDLDSLAGLRVAVARGSSNDIFLGEVAPPGTKITQFDSEALATQALLSGQVDAAVKTNTDIAALLRRQPADRSKITEKFVLATQANALVVRQNDFVLHQYLNTFIYYVKATGKLNALYRKWVHVELPPLPTF